MTLTLSVIPESAQRMSGTLLHLRRPGLSGSLTRSGGRETHFLNW